jgi:hypothetical protein
MSYNSKELLKDVKGVPIPQEFDPLSDSYKVLARKDLFGKSTDTKPTGVEVGTTFFEIDTKSVYVYDGAAWADMKLGTTDEFAEVSAQLTDKADRLQVDQIQSTVNSFQNSNDLAAGKDPETIGARTNTSGQTFETVQNRANFAEIGATFNWDSSPFAYNVKKFEYLSPLEQGYINWNGGGLQTNTTNVRSQNYFIVSSALTVINKNPSLYNYRIFDYDVTTNAFISYQGWITTGTSTISTNSNKRKLCFQRTDGGTILTVNEIMNNFIFYDVKKAIRNPIESIVIGAGKYNYPEITGSGDTITITITQSLFALDYTGKQVQFITTYTTSNPGIFTLASNQMLVWNLDDNQIVVLGNNSARNTNNVVLISDYKGYAQNGFWSKYFNRETLSLPVCERDYEIQNGAWLWGQDGTYLKSKNEVWAFLSGADDHTTNGDVYVWDLTNNTTSTKFTHNLGHVASCDYNKNSDAIILGNGSGDTTNKPRIDIIENASTQPSGKLFQYGNSGIISIPLFTGTREIGGTGAVACWGAGKNIVWMFTEKTGEKVLYKILLGMGTNNLSSDYGTFISGKTANQYNGTAKVLESFTYDGDNLPVMQGVAYKDGHIYLGCSSSRIYIFKIQPTNKGKYKIVDTININQYKNDGTIQALELEGVCFVDDGILSTVFGDGSVVPNSVIKIIA